MFVLHPLKRPKRAWIPTNNGSQLVVFIAMLVLLLLCSKVLMAISRSVVVLDNSKTSSSSLSVLPLTQPISAYDDVLKSTFPNKKEKLRLICTLLRDEAKYLAHWVDFHLNLAGFNKIIIYDDHSSDSIQEVLAKYPRDRVKRIPVDWTYRIGDTSGPNVHYQFSLQLDVYRRCYEENWTNAEAIITIDVDEYFFPARSHWADQDPFASAMRFLLSQAILGPEVAAIQHVHCFRYGLNGHKTDPPLTENLFLAYPKRGPTIRYNEPRSPLSAAATRACLFCQYIFC